MESKRQETVSVRSVSSIPHTLPLKSHYNNMYAHTQEAKHELWLNKEQ